MAQSVDESLIVKPVKAGPLRVRIYDTLRELIFSGKLAPGDPIREAHMAKALQVSQPTLREALIQLEHAGLVVRNPQRDTTVTRLTEQDVQERSRLRALLEPEAAVAAVARMGEAEYQMLDAKLEAIHRSLAADSYHEFAAADLEFHRYIWELSGDRTLYKVLDFVTVPLFAFLSIRRSRTLKHLATVVQSHDPMVAALKAKDLVRIREAFRQHVEDSYRDFPQAPQAG
jgi:DNA-binding GntR family transcriptional regulator